jgi:hypothetical protein
LNAFNRNFNRFGKRQNNLFLRKICFCFFLH